MYKLTLVEQAQILQRLANSWPHDSTRKAAIERALSGGATDKDVKEIRETLQRCLERCKGNARDQARRALAKE